MFKPPVYFYIALLFCSLQIKHSYATDNQNNFPVLNVLSSQDISLVISELSRIYSQSEKVNVLGNFDSISSLIEDVEYGSPADLIITSHPQWIKTLKQKGLIDITSTDELFYDKLVFIAANSDLKFPRFSVIENYSQYKFILPESNNDSLSLYLSDIIFKDPLISKLTEVQLIKTTSDSKKLLISNPKFFSINFYSNIYDDQKFKIIGEVSDDTIQSISYIASIIATDNSEKAERFLTFLKSPEATLVYKKYGFKIHD